MSKEDTKLTLSINKQVIEAARKYAKKKNTSLSGLIENYLVSISKFAKTPEEDISPLVKSLSGILKADKEGDYKKRHADFLANKYK